MRSGRSASPPPRERRDGLVSGLSHATRRQDHGMTGQPKLIASREVPLRGQAIRMYRSSPTNCISALFLRSHGGGRGTLHRSLGRHQGRTGRRSSPRFDRTLTSIHGHVGPKTSNSSRWIEWGEERWWQFHNSFIENGLRTLEKQSAGINRTGAPPQRVLRKCELRNTPAPAPGSKKGGVAPVHLRFPRAGTAKPGMWP